jgi:hypothetical protein
MITPHPPRPSNPGKLTPLVRYGPTTNVDGTRSTPGA